MRRGEAVDPVRAVRLVLVFLVFAHSFVVLELETVAAVVENKVSASLLRSGVLAVREVDFVYSVLAAVVAAWAAVLCGVVDLRVGRHLVVFFEDGVQPVRWYVLCQVLLRIFSSCFVSPADRGGEGRRRRLGSICFWWGCCRWFSPMFPFWPAVVARGTAVWRWVMVVEVLDGAEAAGCLVVAGGRCSDRDRSSRLDVVAARRLDFAVFYIWWWCFLPAGWWYGGSGVL